MYLLEKLFGWTGETALVFKSLAQQTGRTRKPSHPSGESPPPTVTKVHVGPHVGHVDTCRNQTASAKGLAIAVVYGIISASMAFVNKAVLNSYNFNYPNFLVICQMVFGIVILESLRLLKVISLHKYTLENGKNFFLPSMFYAIHSVMALSALSGMNIPMYGLIKRCSPVVILLFGSVILKKGMPSKAVCLSVGCMTIGFIVAGLGDLAFDMKAYTIGIASVFTQSFYLILVQKYSKLGATETLYLNSYNTLPLLCGWGLVFHDFREALVAFDYTDTGFVFTFLLVISMGCFLNYMLFLCTTYNCALTTSITGSLKSIVQTAIGAFTFGGISINAFTVTGMVLNLGAGVLYSFAKYRQNCQQKSISRESSEAQLSQLGASNGQTQCIQMEPPSMESNGQVKLDVHSYRDNDNNNKSIL